MNEKYVYADLPRTGLCNMLFPWARATLYARDHKLPMIAPEWVKLGRLGPWLRGERDKRYYFGQFSNDGYITGLRRKMLLLFCKRQIRVFSGMRDYFKDIAGEADYLKAALFKIVNPTIVKTLEQLPRKFIGVHIRRGDFATTGQALSNDYYVAAIKKAQGKIGVDCPILVFSDARPEELDYLKEFENLKLMPKAPAIQDLLSLSRSTILVGTDNSTFSGWAEFLGQMPMILKSNLETSD